MGNRLTKIYTRTGDDGATGLGDGSRVDKDDPRLEAIGTIDELNSALAMVLAQQLPTEIRDCLTDIQHDLFEVGADLSVPGRDRLQAERTRALEQLLDHFNADLPYLKEFILPGGGAAAAACHLARSICRRAERRLVALKRTDTPSPNPVSYLNRLSDLLFVLARVLARQNGGETLWRRDR